MNRDYRDYPASIWDAIGDVDQGICCAALGGVVWDFMSHLTPAQLLAAMDSATLETLRAIRDILEDDTLEDPECVQRIDAILSAFYLPPRTKMRPGLLSPGRQLAEKASQSSRPQARIQF